MSYSFSFFIFAAKRNWKLFWKIHLVCFKGKTYFFPCSEYGIASGADWVLKPAVAKILKWPFLPFLSSFFFVSNQPWAAQNQAAHVAIAKTPQRLVRLCIACLFDSFVSRWSINEGITSMAWQVLKGLFDWLILDTKYILLNVLTGMYIYL